MRNIDTSKEAKINAYFVTKTDISAASRVVHAFDTVPVPKRR